MDCGAVPYITKEGTIGLFREQNRTRHDVMPRAHAHRTATVEMVPLHRTVSRISTDVQLVERGGRFLVPNHFCK